MLTVPESCPKIGLLCKTGMMAMHGRRWSKKMMLIVRITMKDESALSRQEYEETRANGWPGGGSLGRLQGIWDSLC